MKSKLSIILGILLSLFLVYQVFFFIKHSGRAYLYVSNESYDIEMTDVQIYLDGRLIIQDSLSNASTHNYDRFDIKSSGGDHTIVIEVNSEFKEEIELNTLIGKRIYVDFYTNQDEALAGSSDSHYFVITMRSVYSPSMIM